MPRVHRLSLRATGTPASGPGSSPAATAASTAAAAARASSAITRLKAWISPSRSSMAARCSSTTSAARCRSGPDVGGDATADAGPGGSARHGASPRMRRHPEPAVLGVGRLGQHLVAVEAGLDHVVAQHVAQRQRVGGRRHAGGVEGRDVGGVLEDGAELLGEALQLVVGEVEAGQPGHVGDVGPGDASAMAVMVGGALRAGPG